MNDPDIRKFCVLSLGKILQSVLLREEDLKSFELVFKTFLKTISDFTLDKRGDIGMIIREQTIDSSYDILKTITSHYPKEKID